MGKRRTMTNHHVPPKSVGARFILKKTMEEHRAYHTLFGNAASLEACIHILLHYWWTPQDSGGDDGDSRNHRVRHLDRSARRRNIHRR